MFPRRLVPARAQAQLRGPQGSLRHRVSGRPRLDQLPRRFLAASPKRMPPLSSARARQFSFCCRSSAQLEHLVSRKLEAATVGTEQVKHLKNPDSAHPPNHPSSGNA